MVGRFLITTADQRTWKAKSPILFLGSWCKIYSEREVWGNLDYETVEYHWDDRNQALKDHKYLNSLYEDILVSLTKSLNQIHQVNHNIEYWRILVGPWLYYFIQTIFDRWQMIVKVSNNYQVRETILLDIKDEIMIPNDFVNFEEKYTGDLWNHWIYGKILKELTLCEIKKVRLQKEVLKNNKSILSIHRTKEISIKILKALFEFFQRISKFNKVFIFQSLFTPLQLAKLEIKLGQFPMKFQEKKINSFSTNKDLRKSLVFNYKPQGKFEKFLLKMISLQIPKIYLEGYMDLSKNVDSVNWPKQPKVIISSSIIASDFFKCWVADKKEKGSKLIIAQHGGLYGIGKWQSNETHERLTSDLFLSWGWTGKGVKALAASKISASKTQLKTNPNGGLLLTQACLPRYSYWMYSVPIAGQLEHYLNDQIVFAQTLSEKLRRKLIVKLYPKDYGWSQKERWINQLPLTNIAESNSSYIDLVKQSRINICTYNATTFLESLGSNIPTIIFWNPLFWEVRDSALEDLDKLREVGMLFNSPEAAAKKVEDIWDTVELWWENKEIQDARKDFCNKYAKTSSTCLEDWSEMIKDNMDPNDH